MVAGHHHLTPQQQAAAAQAAAAQAHQQALFAQHHQNQNPMALGIAIDDENTELALGEQDRSPLFFVSRSVMN